MAVSSEISSLLDAIGEPSMLIRPEDLTVAAVNSAFRKAYGNFRFEGRRCWEALHRSCACPGAGMVCPLARAGETKTGVSVRQQIFSSAKTTNLTVTSRAVRSGDGSILFWLETVKTETAQQESFSRGMVGVSVAHAEVLRKIEQTALVDAPFACYGEEGSGRELAARTVHENSARACGPFVTVSGAALKRDAAEKILLGANGAGLMLRAAGGTLFIDEIARASRAAQELIYEVLLQGRAATPEDKTVELNFRLAASSCVDLRAEVALGRFHAALAELLSGLSIDLPPLRERTEDIAVLTKHFVRGIAPVNARSITREAIAKLMSCSWPGNIAQLRDVVEAAARKAADNTISSGDITTMPVGISGELFALDAPLISLEELRDRYLVWAERRFSGQRAELATRLGVSERTFYRLWAAACKRLGVKKDAEQSAE